MGKTVKGVFRNGKVELLEPAPVTGEARVQVTFPDAPCAGDFRQFLLNGPTLPKSVLDDIVAFIERPRRWGI